MLRYTDYDIVFREIPDETTLAVNLAGCPNRCPGCHSPQLQEPIGEPLTEEVVERLLARYGAAVTCFCLMGGDAARGSAAGALRPPAAARPAHGVVLRTCGVARRVRSDGSFRLRETRPLHRCAGAARRSGDQPAAMAHPARRPTRRSHAAVLARTAGDATTACGQTPRERPNSGQTDERIGRFEKNAYLYALFYKIRRPKALCPASGN